MKKERIIFYSRSDLAFYGMKESIYNLLTNIDNHKNYYDINDVIELYNVNLYIDNGIIDELTINNTKQSISRINKAIWSKINLFFNTIHDDNIEKYYSEIDDFIYKKQFWDLFENCKLYNRISKDVFINLFNKTTHIDSILQNRNIVQKYDSALSLLLKEYKNAAELIISNYELEERTKKLYFPSSLSMNDKEEIISKYIDDSDCNTNYVKIAATATANSDFKLSNLTRLKAKRKYDSEIKKMHESNECAKIPTTLQISYSANQQEAKVISQDGLSYNCTYSLTWIKRNNCQEQLFCNFKYLFDYTDTQGRINLVPYYHEDNFIDFIGLHAKKEFKCGYVFEIKNKLALMNIVAYNKILTDMNLQLENIICNVFNTFCNPIENLEITLPVSDNILSNIRYIAPEMESILKKYKTYIEYDKIDLELISISSQPCKIEELPSKCNKKYIYADKNIEDILFLLFSEQGHLKYDGINGNNYNNLYEFLINETLDFNSLEEYRRKRYDKLITGNYLYVDNDGKLKFVDEFETSILYEVYKYGVISYWHLSTDIQSKIDKMIDEGKLYLCNTLFTNDEADYFNYFLNKTFCNGMDLRNKYLHGSHSYEDSTMKKDYYRLLILFVLILYKIIDDLLCYEQYCIHSND